jgi:HNH endonuclease
MCGCGQPTTVAKKTNRNAERVKGQPLRYLRGHNGRNKILYREEDRGYSTPCWIWLLNRLPSGYGRIRTGRGSTRAMTYAHRFIYEQKVGAIPAGLELDHLCFVPACVNPAHLEPVTPAENKRRRRQQKDGRRA